ncbi:trypsin-like peptidase domain-containing protein [Reinekea marina]|uniref:S1C family serine protease n=1 Tax=Reinekea marina TaxID=1310421 RepID=A0ABV7WND8_9GAMM|nr:trypsin-like peptidase domain-containing protein [Reinekea marina]MDN3648742.1 trypsin-like peptidase domain-containing protein [Reinekea marina]
MQFLKNHKEWILTFIVGGLAAILLITSDIRQPSEPLQGYASSLKQVRPFVVSIYTQSQLATDNHSLLNDPLLNKYITTLPKSSLGSGILLGENGLVVTNAHVIRDASNIIIQTYDGQRVPAEHYWLDEESDIALIQTKLSIDRALPISTKTQTQVGDIAFTIGNPFGFGQSVSMGIISATSREQSTLTSLTDFIQTDAAINPGNSGGALVNSIGEIIGMNSAVLSASIGAQGIGFAIPINTVKNKVASLQNQPPMQPKIAGFIGIDVIEDNQLNQLRIISVKSGSPAQQAGLQVDDLINKIDGIDFRSRQQLIDYVRSQPVSQELSFNVKRQGQQTRTGVSIAPSR